MENLKTGTELEDFLAEQLPEFDAVLAKRGVHPKERALQASRLVVEHCIVEVKGDTKDDYLSKSWFGLILRGAITWYEKRYGNALQRKSSFASVVISAFGTPFRAEVPLVFSESPLPDKTFWLRFPVDVQPHEDHMAWIVNPPNFDSSTVEERDQVSSALIEVATQIRAIYINVMTAHHETDSARSLAEGILPGLEKGALDIARAEPNSLSMAVWELNFACERVIKTFLRHKQVEPPHTHDIHCLHRLATDKFGSSELDCEMKILPPGKVAVKHRYTELPPPTFTEALSIYRAALRVANGYSYRLSRKWILNNAAIQLKIPPWFEET